MELCGWSLVESPSQQTEKARAAFAIDFSRKPFARLYTACAHSARMNLSGVLGKNIPMLQPVDMACNITSFQAQVRQQWTTWDF
jgi:hypothetical protein